METADNAELVERLTKITHSKYGIAVRKLHLEPHHSSFRIVGEFMRSQTAQATYWQSTYWHLDGRHHKRFARDLPLNN